MKTALDGDPIVLGKVLTEVPEVVMVLDRDGTIRYINHVEEGYDRDIVIGMRAEDVLPPESLETFRAAVNELFLTGEVQGFELRVASPTGATLWFRSRMSPLHDAGVITAAVIIATNVSALKLAEAEVERLRGLLPICSWCDRIQSEAGVWRTIEAHLESESGTKVTHGLCPDCFRDQMRAESESDGTNGNVA